MRPGEDPGIGSGGSAAVVFSHPDVGSLRIFLPPTSVQWTYHLNTNVVDTYAGQVVQLLSLNFDKFIIEGRFGREGPHGADGVLEKLRPRPIEKSQDFLGAGERGVGLSQMTAWFQAYFAVAGQGGPKAADGGLRGHYNQRVVTVTYDTDSDAIDAGAGGAQSKGKWKVYPTAFPSFHRSKEAIAPEWRVECEVVEPDFALHKTSMKAELKRLEDIASGFGYRPFNPYSDPLGEFIQTTKSGKLTKPGRKQLEQLVAQQNKLFDVWSGLIPALNPDEVDRLIFFGSSVPITSPAAAHAPPPAPASTSKGKKKTPPVAHGSHGGTGEPGGPSGTAPPATSTVTVAPDGTITITSATGP